MALEGMHRELLSHLQAKRAAQLLISDCEDAGMTSLRQRGKRSHVSLVQSAFSSGALSKLNPLPSHGAFGQARCSRCGTVFVFLSG